MSDAIVASLPSNETFNITLSSPFGGNETQSIQIIAKLIGPWLAVARVRRPLRKSPRGRCGFRASATTCRKLPAYRPASQVSWGWLGFGTGPVKQSFYAASPRVEIITKALPTIAKSWLFWGVFVCAGRCLPKVPRRCARAYA
jgi:hypothetical protein